jgi:hypothetical protein
LYRITEEEVLVAAGLDAYVVGIALQLYCRANGIVPPILQLRDQIPLHNFRLRLTSHPSDPLHVHGQNGNTEQLYGRNFLPLRLHASTEFLR